MKTTDFIWKERQGQRRVERKLRISLYKRERGREREDGCGND